METAHTDKDCAADEANFRLGSWLRPSSYRLHFAPNPQENAFEGHCEILCKLNLDEAPRDKIFSMILHSLNLKIGSAVLDWLSGPSELPLQRIDVTALDDAMVLDPDSVEGIACDCCTASPSCTEAPPQPSNSFPALKVSLNSASETATLSFPFTLDPQAKGEAEVRLRIQYMGSIHSKQEQMFGMFKCDAASDDHFLVTHLEPTNARRLYPCFDEPCFKATYQLIVDFDASYQVISGTLAESEEIISTNTSLPPSSTSTAANSPSASRNPSVEQASTQEDVEPPPPELSTPALAPAAAVSTRRTVFKPTPLLSTYLIAFATGKFHMLQQNTKRRGLLCRVLFPVNDPLNEGWFALDLLTKAVDFYENFFQHDLPLEKLDIVGINEFAVLGMENWGMMVFLKEYLLVKESTPIERRQRIARLIGHEVAHQWYGNLISVSWWTHLWLKEGFCRYLEFVFVNSCFPQWSIWSEFLVQILDEALMQDCKPEKTHPVESCCSEPRRIFDAFDVISYGKGASLLRMLASTIGDDKLETAIQLLVRRFAFSNFSKGEFLECLQSAVANDPEKVELCHLIVDWVTVEGHPLVIVQKSRGTNGMEQINTSQYLMPDLNRGILPHYVNVKGGSVLTPRWEALPSESSQTPRLRDFVWNPDDVLTPSNFAIPITVMDLMLGQSSVRRSIVVRATNVLVDHHPSASSSTATPTRGTPPPPPQHPLDALPIVHQRERSTSFGPWEGLTYFNYGTTGVFRCDYDATTWLRVFEFSPFLTNHDRLVITMTLFRLRTLHIGKIAADEPIDRCTLLLEWLVHISQQRSQIHSTLWRYVTDHVEVLIYLLKDHPCWSVFAEFCDAVFQPVVQQGLLSLHIQERPFEFQATGGVSRQTSLHILHILGICKASPVLEEAEQSCDWAVSKIIEQPTDCMKQSLHKEPIALPNAVAAANVVVPQVVPLQASSVNSNGSAAAAVASIQSGASPVLPPMATSSPTPSPVPSAVNSAPMSKDFDIRSDAEVTSVTIAMQTVCENGDVNRWWKLASILAALVGVDLLSNIPSSFVEAYQLPQISIKSEAIVGESVRNRWINLVAPSVCVLEDTATFNFIIAIVRCFTGMSAPLAKAILRNTKLLTAILEQKALSPTVRNALIAYGATYCSNANVAALLRCDLLGVNLADPSLSPRQSASALGYPSTSTPPGAHPQSSKWPQSVSPQTARAMERLELNCAWVDYVCEHYTKFLKNKRKEGLWAPSANRPHFLSHSDPPPGNELHGGGVSI